jgi:transcriptional regulator with AAA-type ATPase domain/transcriptional regulatory protein LevR
MEKIKNSRSEKVYQKVKELTNRIGSVSEDFLDLTTEIIAKETGLDRSNVSKELNKLFDQKKVVKISGKPVIYLDKSVIESKISKPLKRSLYKNTEEFEEEVKKDELTSNKNSIKQHSILDSIVGTNDSLRGQTNQGKAAILYPPKGLHMIIVGETGVGKSTFAEVMYRYAIEVKKFTKESPFIIFNCADYCENPQLLLSQLFGHAKGAFTGADKEKKGLVELANGGILFLDEIHRLPPEGQEMMFLLMDKGIFRRLGESENFRESKVLIIAATTEDPQSSMLHTFLRRIPSIIKLPPLRQRSINERITLIYNFFHEEFLRVKVPIRVSNEVIKALAIYDCPGNIGQLKSDIQLICAKGFLDYISETKSCIEIKLSQLSESIISGYFNITDKRNKLINFTNLNSSGSVSFGVNQLDVQKYIENIFTNQEEKENNEDVYEIIQNQFLNLSTTELSSKEIKNKVDIKIEKYFHRLLNRASSNQKTLNQEAASTIINPNILAIVEEVLEEMKDEIGKALDTKIKFGLALHINTLIERIQIGSVISNPNKNEIKQQHPKEYMVAEKLRRGLQERLVISIPEDEAAFLAMFICAAKAEEKDFNVGVLIIAHGHATAKSMASVANKLLGTEQAHAIDMLLEEKVENVLEKAIEEVKKIDMGKGVLLLVDMGSLTSFSEIITQKTKINTKCISMVSTLMVIEAARKSLMPDTTLDKLYHEIEMLASRLNGIEYNSLNRFKDTHIERALLNILEETLSFLNVEKACNILLKCLKNILADIHEKIDDRIKTKFLFHCCCMIERVIRGEAFLNKSISEIITSKKRYFMLVKKHFECVEETFGICIPDTEIGYIVEILDTHFDTHESKLISINTV